MLLFQGAMIPFLGTVLGSACVFLLKGQLNRKVEKGLNGFASGVMVAASIWSLLIPAMDWAEDMGKFAFVPAVVGFWGGIAFLLILDHIIPHLHRYSDKAEGPNKNLAKTTMMVFAVTLHNIPEGMAVGVVFAGLLAGESLITTGGAFALAIGIALQNFPEGAIISLPLRAEGESKWKAFIHGALSGVVEPIGFLLTLLASGYIAKFLPYSLSFAAGAMLYVVVEELIPEMNDGEHSDIGVLCFALGFTLMMALDVALG